MAQKDTFLEGKIVFPLIKFTIPLALTLVVQALYGAVDMIIVGQLSTTANFSAVAIGSLIMQALTAVVSGVAMGITVHLGHCIGGGKHIEAAQTVGGGIKIFMMLSLLLTCGMIFFAPELALIMETPPEAFDYTVSYVRICSSGTIFIVGYNIISGIFRGLGNSQAPLLFVCIACIVNIAADLWLVGSLQMGAAGAAYATVLAQGISVLFSVIYIYRRKLPFVFSFKHVLHSAGAVKHILCIGVPVAAQDFLNFASFMVLAAIVNSLGLVASAAMGIEGKIFPFFNLIPIAFMSGLSAFVAQNIGAKQERRAIAALKKGILIAFFIGSGSFLITFWGGELLGRIFEKNTEVIMGTARLLRGASFEHLIYPFVFCLLGYFNGKALTVFVVVQSLIYAFLVRIPLAYYLKWSGNVDLLFIGYSLSFSALVSLLICGYYFVRKAGVKPFIFLFRWRKNMKKYIKSSSPR